MSIPSSSSEATANQAPSVDFEAAKFWQWGWNRSAEIWNGRLAMLLFMAFVIFAWTLS